MSAGNVARGVADDGEKMKKEEDGDTSEERRGAHTRVQCTRTLSSVSNKP
jgi:hypothetical protein